jgi:hypothetical protein
MSLYNDFVILQRNYYVIYFYKEVNKRHKLQGLSEFEINEILSGNIQGAYKRLPSNRLRSNKLKGWCLLWKN